MKKQHKIWKHRSCSDDALLKINMIPEIMGLSEASSTNDSDPESWHVQVIEKCDAL